MLWLLWQLWLGYSIVVVWLAVLELLWWVVGGKDRSLENLFRRRRNQFSAHRFLVEKWRHCSSCTSCFWWEKTTPNCITTRTLDALSPFLLETVSVISVKAEGIERSLILMHRWLLLMVWWDLLLWGGTCSDLLRSYSHRVQLLTLILVLGWRLANHCDVDARIGIAKQVVIFTWTYCWWLRTRCWLRLFAHNFKFDRAGSIQLRL